jgi:Cu/Ag efflux protein CusF
MRPLITALLLSAAITTALLGCQGQSGSSSQSQGTGAKVYDVRGKVVSIDAGKKVVTLDHEDIPGLMKAMTMDFPVGDARVLDGLKAGDAVQGKIKSEGGSYSVTSLEKR